MKSKLALGTMLAVALVAPAALPCGAPFGNGINVDPRQDIVVVHKNGTETYVFQPRFCGSAKEFGLILPVPAKLAAQPALSKAEVFTKLVEVSQPQIVYTTACANRGGPGDAGAGNWGSGGGSGTTVVSSGTVGFMDYAQIETSSVGALTTWLTSNGYPYDALATSAFDYYVQKGWLFVTFKVNQGDFAGTTTCKDLGPVKLSFPTSIPVVPTRMATARTRDTSGALSYATNFSWRVFGITEGSQEIGFATGADYVRAFNFSGLLDSAAVGALDGLAVAGDRATKLTVTFNYGSTDPDIALRLATGQDYRETINQVTYIQCTDGGPDSADTAGLDASPVADGSVVQKDTIVVTTPDLGPPADSADTIVILPPPPESIDKGDAGVVSDSATVVTADAGAASKDAGTSTPVVRGGGCSFTASSGADGALPALWVVALLLGLRRRKWSRRIAR
jgi:hypothetical protein